MHTLVFVHLLPGLVADTHVFQVFSCIGLQVFILTLCWVLLSISLGSIRADRGYLFSRLNTGCVKVDWYSGSQTVFLCTESRGRPQLVSFCPGHLRFSECLWASFYTAGTPVVILATHPHLLPEAFASYTDALVTVSQASCLQAASDCGTS